MQVQYIKLGHGRLISEFFISLKFFVLKS